MNIHHSTFIFPTINKFPLANCTTQSVSMQHLSLRCFEVYLGFCVLKVALEIAFAIYTLWLWNILFAIVQVAEKMNHGNLQLQIIGDPIKLYKLTKVEGLSEKPYYIWLKFHKVLI